MNSKVAEAIGLDTHAVAMVWTDALPEGATCFKPGRWGCVMGLVAAVAAKGKVCAFDRQTYGCWGGGVGLGFGNCYEAFPGGVECFCRFLADGNENSEEGRAVGEKIAAWGNSAFSDDFLRGERYLKSPDVTRRFLQAIPTRDIPAKYVVFKPLERTDPEQEAIKSISFFVDADQLSALVVLANHTEPDMENVAVPWGAACQIMGIFGYRELERDHPRALLGLTDLSARATVRSALGKNALSLTAPWPVFLRMEQDVESSFLQRETWHRLREPNGSGC